MVYVAPYNGKIWGDFTKDNSNAEFLVEISFNSAEDNSLEVITNQKPYFETPLHPELQFTSNSWIEKYEFPTILDLEENKPYRMIVKGLNKQFM